MREKIRKARSRSNPGKEVTFKVEKSGLKSDGSQRRSATFRFYGGSEKKISGTGYAAADVDGEEHRIYFVEADAAEGWKLTGDKNVRVLSFTIKALDTAYEWTQCEGSYSLLKDIASGDYYIDLVTKEAK